MATKIKFSTIITHIENLGFGALEFKNYRRPLQTDKSTWPELQQIQIEHLSCPEPIDDAFDICLRNSEEPIFQLYLYPYGSGTLFLHNSTTKLGIST